MVIDLFGPYRIGKLEMKNRFVRSATWDGSADSTGAVTDTSVALYRELGRGGIGLIVSGYAFISVPGQAAFGQYGVYSDDMIPGLCRLVQAVHQYGGKIALQIVHAGISAVRDDIPALVVSRMPQFGKPQREMTEEDIESIIGDFAAAAVRAREAGFDAVQLHGAHGYLMSQFLSPLLNRRTDRWGGSIENRRRFHLEVIRRVRQVIGADFPLLLKFGVQDESARGLSLADGVETARLMVQAGIEAIEVSNGVAPVRYITPTFKADEPARAVFRERAAAVKRAVNVPVILVGGIRSLGMAKDIVNSGDADLIAMCRPFIREPGLLKQWQESDGQPARCISCNQCFTVFSWRGESIACGQERRLWGGKVGG